jgi:alcohol dehydrogenase class IV
MLQRFEEIARILTGNPAAAISDGMAWIKQLFIQLDIPSLGQFGLKKSDLPVIASNALKASSMGGNPVNLHETDLIHILEQALK